MLRSERIWCFDANPCRKVKKNCNSRSFQWRKRVEEDPRSRRPECGRSKGGASCFMHASKG